MMEYLKNINQDLINRRIPIRDTYMSHDIGTNHVEDVVNDLNDHGHPLSIACLPLAKQIVDSDRKITLLIPQIGDVFFGIVHHPVIARVTYIFSNYSEESAVEAQLHSLGELMVWQVSELPLPVLTIDDYAHINLRVQIEITHQYTVQNSNQDNFKVCFGYFNQIIRDHLIRDIVIYEIPLLNQSYLLKIVCGLWCVTQKS
jgi:hypothetical protein